MSLATFWHGKLLGYRLEGFKEGHKAGPSKQAVKMPREGQLGIGPSVWVIQGNIDR